MTTGPVACEGTVRRAAITAASLALLLLSACATREASPRHGPQPAAAAPGYVHAGTVLRDQSITSRITGITYPFHVYLPQGHAGSGRRYPVIYATDGQWHFGAFSRLLDQRQQAAILVSVEQGPPGRREVDYGPEGAAAYGRFLREELAPLIEARYPTAGPRSFVGTSYGGLLGAILLTREDAVTPFFSRYLLFDGAFWALTPAELADEAARFAANPRLPVTLLLTTANDPGNIDDVIALETRYRQRGHQDLVLQRHDFPVAHEAVARPSWAWALDWLEQHPCTAHAPGARC